MTRLGQSLRLFLKRLAIATTNGANSIIGDRKQQFLLVRTLGLGLVSVLFILAFALLAGEMLEGDTRAFDMALFGAAQSLQLALPRFFETMRDFSGLGSTIATLLSKHTPIPMEFVAVNDSFGESGTPDQLLTKYGLDTIDVFNAAERVIKRK